MNKILIVGGAGYIGRSIIKAFSCTNYNISIYDNCLKYGDNIPKYATVIKGDIRNIERLNNLTKNYDYVIWCSDFHDGINNLDKNQESLSSEMLELLQDNKFRMIYISDACVYDPSNMFAESDEQSCTYETSDSYEYYKLLSESIVEQNFKNYSILRLSNVYGFTHCGMIKKNNVINNSIFTLINNGVINELEDDEYPISIIDVKDVGNAILKIIERNFHGIINLGSENTNWNLIIEECKKYVYFEKFENNNNFHIKENLLGHLNLNKIKDLGFKQTFKLQYFVYDIKNKYKGKNNELIS